LTECPKCGTQLELVFDLNQIRTSSQETLGNPYQLSIEEWQVFFRLPNSMDLLAITSDQGPDGARRALLLRCLLHSEQNGEEKSNDQLPEHIASAVIDQMAQLDLQGDVELGLTCPECANQWLANFDIVRFLWRELDAWAIRTLQDVHKLASAYGWREADILAMNPLRRQVYLELIG
jgi:hypothetical protein